MTGPISGGRHRLRELLVAGLTDSFGLAVGWTVFNLLAVARGGLAAAGLYNAAMLVGVVLAAPATAWLSARLDGRALLRATAGAELVLRAATFAALLAGWPAPLVAAGVTVLNIAAFSGFAAMRAEVAAAAERAGERSSGGGTAGAMTWYLTGVAVVESAGAGVAALLPLGAGGTIHGGLAGAVTLLYVVSLLPTFACAGRALVGRVTPEDGGRGLPFGALAGSAAVMAIGAGPSLLAVALAAQLHGQAAVAGAVAAASAGSLLAPGLVRLLGRARLPARVSWPLLGAGMLAGWVAAPWHLAGLLGAQALSGLARTAFEGASDARVAGGAGPSGATTALAWSAATRALGGAVAVRLLPLAVAAPAVGRLSAALAAVLALAALALAAASLVQGASWFTSGTPSLSTPVARQAPQRPALKARL